MKLSVGIAGHLKEILEAEIKAGSRAVSGAMAEAGSGLKLAWRGQIRAAGLGTRLGNSIRSATYPKGHASLRAAALVWTQAPEIIAAHDRGVTIRSKDGFWLAIPTEAAGRAGRGKRMTPELFEQRSGLRLRFIYRRGRPSLLVAEGRVTSKGRAVGSRSKTGRGVATVPVFILVPQVKLPKRLDLFRDADRVASALDRLIVAHWDREDAR